MLMQFVAVAIGGALGACARFGIGVMLPVIPGKWPLATFTANVVGCLCIGIVYSLLSREYLALSLKPLLIGGFLGALTTFSSFALEALVLLEHNAHFMALTYLMASLIACLSAAYLGQYLTNTLIP